MINVKVLPQYKIKAKTPKTANIYNKPILPYNYSKSKPAILGPNGYSS